MRHATTTLALAIAFGGVSMLGTAHGQLRVFGTGGDDVWVDPGPGPTPPRVWDPDDLPVSEETIAINHQLYEIREEIALLATWLGPGPNDINTILSGENDQWIEEMKAEAALIAKELREERLAWLVGLPPVPTASSKTGAAWTRDAGSSSVVPDPSHDTRSHFVPNLWPTVEVNGGVYAEIPYTFSDFMITSFITGGGDDAEAVNAAAGVANAFVVMLILEQELPIRFIGFNPNIHAPNAILLFESTGTGISGAGNAVSQIGRATGASPPTTMTHQSWQNFPSMIRSMGFVIGLDWEQRHPNRDNYIDVDLTAIPPFGFPIPIPPANGVNGPGIPFTVNNLGLPDSGPLFFDLTVTATIVPESEQCDFDLDSIMLMGPFDYFSIEPMYTIFDEFRFVDLDGDGVVDQTVGGPDDRMFSQPNPVFFSECDRNIILTVYQDPDGPGSGWYFGKDDFCPHDVDQNGVQDGRDIRAFLELFENRDPAADIAPPFGQWTQEDLLAYTTTFVPGFCSPTAPPGPTNRPDRIWPD